METSNMLAGEMQAECYCETQRLGSLGGVILLSFNKFPIKIVLGEVISSCWQGYDY